MAPAQFIQRTIDAIREMPGVVSASAVSNLPMGAATPAPPTSSRDIRSARTSCHRCTSSSTRLPATSRPCASRCSQARLRARRSRGPTGRDHRQRVVRPPVLARRRRHRQTHPTGWLRRAGRRALVHHRRRGGRRSQRRPRDRAGRPDLLSAHADHRRGRGRQPHLARVAGSQRAVRSAHRGQPDRPAATDPRSHLGHGPQHTARPDPDHAGVRRRCHGHPLLHAGAAAGGRRRRSDDRRRRDLRCDLVRGLAADTRDRRSHGARRPHRGHRAHGAEPQHGGHGHRGWWWASSPQAS